MKFFGINIGGKKAILQTGDKAAGVIKDIQARLRRLEPLDAKRIAQEEAVAGRAAEKAELIKTISEIEQSGMRRFGASLKLLRDDIYDNRFPAVKNIEKLELTRRNHIEDLIRTSARLSTSIQSLNKLKSVQSQLATLERQRASVDAQLTFQGGINAKLQSDLQSIDASIRSLKPSLLKLEKWLEEVRYDKDRIMTIIGVLERFESREFSQFNSFKRSNKLVVDLKNSARRLGSFKKSA